MSSGATLAVAVGGQGEWNSGTSDDIATLLGQAAFASGAVLGIDVASGNFTYEAALPIPAAA